jgi:hypothetical protein
MSFVIKRDKKYDDLKVTSESSSCIFVDKIINKTDKSSILLIQNQGILQTEDSILISGLNGGITLSSSANNITISTDVDKGLIFVGNNITDYIPTPLNCYEDTTTLTAAVTGAITLTIALRAIRIGNVVTIIADKIITLLLNNDSIYIAVPPKFATRVPSKIWFAGFGQNNGAPANLIIRAAPTYIQISVNNGGAPQSFTSGAIGGYEIFCLTYTI